MLNLFKNDIKELYIEKLKGLIQRDHVKTDKLIGERYYEWEIKNWSKLNNIEYSSQFSAGNCKWRIKLNKNEITNETEKSEKRKSNLRNSLFGKKRNTQEDNEIGNPDYISISLENLDNLKDTFDLEHIFANYIVSLRNSNDYSSYYANDSTSLYFNKVTNTKNIYKNFEKKCLYELTNESYRPIIENDKIIIGIYIKVYKYNKEQYIDELRQIISNDEMEDDIIGENYSEIEIDNWNKIIEYGYGPKTIKEFTIGEYKWAIKLHFFGKRKRNEENFYVYVTDLTKDKYHHDNNKNNYDERDSYCSKFLLSFCNSKDYSNFKVISSSLFSKSKTNKKVNSNFINKTNYKNFIKPLIKDNKLIIGVFAMLYNDKKKDQYIEDLKNLINEDSSQVSNIIREDYNEWEIKNWDEMISSTYSGPKFNSKFSSGDTDWDIKISKLNNKYQDLLKIALSNINIIESNNQNLYARYLASFRDSNSFKYYKTELSDIFYYSKNFKSTYPYFLSKEKYENFIKPLVKDGKLIMGIYIQVFESHALEHRIENAKNVVEANNKGSYEVISNQYFEWKVKNWNHSKRYVCSPKFSAGGFNWCIYIYPNSDDKSIYIKNLDILKDKSIHIFANYAFTIYSDDFSLIETLSSSSPVYINYKNNKNGFSKLNNIKIRNENEFIIGVYISIYKYNMEQYSEELKNFMITNQLENEVVKEDYFEWEILDMDFSKKVIYSPEFEAGGHEWNIRLHSNNDINSKKKEFLSVYLENSDVYKEKYSHIYADFLFFIRNPNNYYIFSKKKKPLTFILQRSKSQDLENINGMDFYIKNNYKAKIPLIDNNKTVIGVYIRVYDFNKDRYINEAINLMKNSEDLIGEGYYEWKINNWEDLNNEEYSPKFRAGGLKWKIKFNLDNKENDGYTSIYLENIDVLSDDSLHICGNVLFSIRNYDDYSFYENKENKSVFYFSKEKNISGLDQFIMKNDLFIKNERINKSLVENNKTVITVYMRLFEYKLEQYIDEMNSFIKNNKKTNDEVLGDDCYEWEIEDWDNLDVINRSSDFMIGNHLWSLRLYPNGDEKIYGKNDDQASLYLDNVDSSEENFSHIYAHYILFIRNYSNYSCFVRKRSFSLFNFKRDNAALSDNEKEVENKIDFQIKNKKSNASLIEDGKTVVGVYIRVYKYNKEKYLKELSKLLKESNEKKYKIEMEEYIEWNISDWHRLLNEEYSPIIDSCNYIWKIKLCLNKFDKENKDYISIYFENCDILEENSLHICANVIFVIRNYKDYSFFYGKVNPTINYYSKEKISWGIDKFIKKSDLTISNEVSNKPLVERGYAVIGCYIRLYEYNIVQYNDELKLYINTNKTNNYDIMDESYYEWKIENWSKLQHLEWSPMFMAGGYQWKIKLWPNGYGNIKKKVSIFLENVNTIREKTTHICVKFILTFRNYNNYSYHSSYVSSISYYNNNKKDFGNLKFIDKNDLFSKDQSKISLIKDDKVIVGAFIRIYKYNRKDQYIEELKSLIKYDKRKTNKIISEGYYEWEIENWNKIEDIKYGPEFLIGKFKWQILLYSNDKKEEKEDSMSMWLKNLDVLNENSLHISANFVLSIRNCNDFSCFIGNEDSSLNYFSRDRNLWGFQKFVEKKDLKIINKTTNKKILNENGKITIGAYIRVHKYKIDQYIDELKFFVKDDYINKNNFVGDNLYHWKITDWNNLNNLNYSPEFAIDGHKWKIKLCLNKEEEEEEEIKLNNFISIFIENVENSNINENDLSNIFFNYVLVLSNYKNSSCFIPYVSFYNYLSKSIKQYGNREFIKKSNLITKNKFNNFLFEKNKAKISAYICIYKNVKLGQYINSIKELIKNDDENGKEDIQEEGYYEWVINDWEKLEDMTYSPEFMIGEYIWKIKLYPNGNDKVNNNEYVSVFLENMNTNNYSDTYAKFVLSFRNSNDYSSYRAHSISSLFYFSKYNNSIGFRQFIKKKELYVKNNESNIPLVENDKITVGVYIQIYRNKIVDDPYELKLLKQPYKILPKVITNNPELTYDNIQSPLLKNETVTSLKNDSDLISSNKNEILPTQLIKDEPSSSLTRSDSIFSL